MNRNKEWYAFLEEIKGYVPDQLENSAQKAILRMKAKRNMKLIVTTPLAGVLIFFVLFKTLAKIAKPEVIATGR